MKESYIAVKINELAVNVTTLMTLLGGAKHVSE